MGDVRECTHAVKHTRARNLPQCDGDPSAEGGRVSVKVPAVTTGGARPPAVSCQPWAAAVSPSVGSKPAGAPLRCSAYITPVMVLW